MEDSEIQSEEKKSSLLFHRHRMLWIFSILLIAIGIFFVAGIAKRYIIQKNVHLHVAVSSFFSRTTTPQPLIVVKAKLPVLNKTEYNRRMLLLANRPIRNMSIITASKKTTTTQKQQHYLWPAIHAPYPLAGAIFPFKRVVAYYGNFYSTGMGILGEYPEATVLQKLHHAVEEWKNVDTSTPVLPAVEYIAVTAQASAGKDGNYNARMPADQINHAIEMAKQAHGIVILDVQVGTGNLQQEIHLLKPYLKLPQVHLAIDPEFNMHYGDPPGTVIGSVNAKDINTAAQYLASLVRHNHLPPKILIIHRFTERMVTGVVDIHPLAEVQIVMDMDGWGSSAKKINTYDSVIYPEPVQFTGIKLFYKQDLTPPSTRLLTMQEVLHLRPIPIYIQYQ